MHDLDHEVAKHFASLLKEQRIHSFDDVASVVAAYETACKHALQRKEVEPNYSLGVEMGAKLEEMREQLLVVQQTHKQTGYHPHLEKTTIPKNILIMMIGEKRFERLMNERHPVVDSEELVDLYFDLGVNAPLRIQIPVNQARNSEHMKLNHAYSRIDYRVMQLEDLYVDADKATAFEVVPDQNSGTQYLPTGKAIVPPTATSDDYRVFKVGLAPCRHCDSKETVKFSPELRGFRFLDDALKAIDRANWGTIVIAHDVDGYPLEQTIIPVLEKKYEMALFGRRHQPLKFRHGKYDKQ